MSARWKRAFLQSLAWTAETNGTSIADELRLALQSRVEDAGSGTVLVGSSNAGASVTYALPGGGPDPAGMVEVIGQLYELHTRVVATLGDKPDDPEILAAMLAELVPVRSVSSDFRRMLR